MLRVYYVMLEVIRLVRPLLVKIEARDRAHGTQTRNAENSAALNIAEGSGSKGGTRLERYRTALGSAKETLACLEVAVAQGYIEEIPEPIVVRLNQVIGTLINIVK